MAEPETSDAQMSDAELAKANARLREKLPNAKCEMCGAINWSVNTFIVSPALLAFDRKTRMYMPDLGFIHPSLHVVCGTCGNSKLLSLAVLKFDPFEVGDE
jgi:hypothetical protein